MTTPDAPTPDPLAEALAGAMCGCGHGQRSHWTLGCVSGCTCRVHWADVLAAAVRPLLDAARAEGAADGRWRQPPGQLFPCCDCCVDLQDDAVHEGGQRDQHEMSCPTCDRRQVSEEALARARAEGAAEATERAAVLVEEFGHYGNPKTLARAIRALSAANPAPGPVCPPEGRSTLTDRYVKARNEDSE